MNWPYKIKVIFSRIFFLAIVFFVFIACKSEKDKQIEKFIEKIEASDVNSYTNIQFMIFGEKEVYSYYKSDTIYTTWKFNKLTNHFEELDSLKMETFTDNPRQYAQMLREKIQAIGVVSITQSSPGSKQFWIADNEYITYVYIQNGEPENELLKTELATSEKINDSWHFCRMKVCRNR